MEEAFKSSGLFILSSGSRPGTLIATIPTNVPWKEVDGKTRVLYRIDFTNSQSMPIGQSKGQCWDDQLQRCAEAIVRDATRIAEKVKMDS
jgi:hypothetical protein